MPFTIRCRGDGFHQTNRRGKIMRGKICVLLLAFAAVLASSSEPAAHVSTEQGPEPLPPDVVKVWKAAGAEVGWMGSVSGGLQLFRTLDKGLPGEVPALSLSKWKSGVLPKLPAPERLFGLKLWNTQITDAGLKEMAAMKNLTCLDLSETAVTDAGLKELAGLQKLTTLNLKRTKISNAGLKTLAGLRNLVHLDVAFTKVTDAAVDEFRKELPKCSVRN